MTGDFTGRIVRDFGALEDAAPQISIKSREPEVKALLKCLDVPSRKIRPLQVWISGPPGSGKTSVAQAALEKLHRPGEVHCVYVNCWGRRTLHAMVDHVVRELRLLGVEKIDTRFKLERLRHHVEGKTLIVVLDEIDRVSLNDREAIVYSLSNLGSVGLVCISYSRSAFFEMDKRVGSRLSPYILKLQAYVKDDIIEILHERANRALQDRVWDPQLLSVIADLASGDARMAIRTLKQAAQLAEASNDAQIDPRHVERSWRQVVELRRQYILQGLTKHHALIYQIIRRKGPIQSGNAHSTYVTLCQERNAKPIARRTFTHYVSRLIDVGLVGKERSREWGNVRILKPSRRFHQPGS